MNLSDAEQYRNRLAKNINRNMRRISKAGYKFGAIKEYENFVEKFFPGRKSISERITPKGLELKEEISKLERLAGMKSATYSGAKQIIDKRLATLERRYGLSFKNGDELADFYESEFYEHMKNIYGSKEAVEIVGTSKYTPEQVRGRWEAHRTKTGRQSKSTKSLLSALGFRDKNSLLYALAGIE